MSEKIDEQLMQEMDDALEDKESLQWEGDKMEPEVSNERRSF